MTSISRLPPLPVYNPGSVGVVQLVNHYFAIYILEDKTYFHTKCGKTEISTVEAAARKFGNEYEVPYVEKILTPRAFTVIKIQNRWHSIELCKDQSIILSDDDIMSLSQQNLDSGIRRSQKQIRYLTQNIVENLKGYYVESLKKWVES